jgi:hypothetical protein
MDGTKWSIPLTNVRLEFKWTKDNVTLYRAFEDNQTPYWVEITEIGDNTRSIFVTGSKIQNTTLPVNEFLRKFQSLNLIYL